MVTLHDILNTLNGKEIKKVGGITWNKNCEKLTKILYMVGKLTNLNLDNVIDYLDEIDCQGGLK